MKQISKFSILLLLIVSFSCADDNEITDETSIDTSNYIVNSDSEYPDDTNNVYVSDIYLREFFGWTSVIGGHINEIDGTLDTLVWANDEPLPCPEYLHEYLYLDSSGNLSPYGNAIFETWTRPIPPVNGNSYPVSANSPLNDGIITVQEQNDFIARVLTALSNYPNIPINDINIQGVYSSTSPFVYIKVKIQLIVC